MAVSAAKISQADDRALDKAASKARPAPPGLSIRHGPVGDDAMDIETTANGLAKRKSRSSIGKAVNYKDDSDSDDGAPLVCYTWSWFEALLGPELTWTIRPNVKNRPKSQRRTAMMSRSAAEKRESCLHQSRTPPLLTTLTMTSLWELN
jgi:hypothetical protein